MQLMMDAGRRMAEATLQSMATHPLEKPPAAAEESQPQSASEGDSWRAGGGVQSGNTLATVSSDSSDQGETLHVEVNDDDEDEDMQRIGFGSGGILRQTPPSPMPHSPVLLSASSPAWQVQGIHEAWTDKKCFAASVDAAVGSYEAASQTILDHLQSKLEEGAQAAVAPISGWDTPDNSSPGSTVLTTVSPAGPKLKPKADKKAAENVKLVSTYPGEFRCAAVCGSAVWLADRNGRIEVRSRASRIVTSSGKVR